MLVCQYSGDGIYHFHYGFTKRYAEPLCLTLLYFSNRNEFALYDAGDVDDAACLSRGGAINFFPT